MNYDLEQIREISILSVAHKLNIEVKRNNKALCYNGHDRKTPSLSFNDKKGVYKCFGCNEGGDSIALVQNSLKLNFKESCQWLLEAFNLSPSNGRKRKLPKKRVRIKEEGSSFRMNPKIYSWLIDKLDLSEESLLYLKSRGFKQDTIESLKIRDYDPTGNVFDELINTWTQEDLLNCGIVKKAKSEMIKLVWWDKTILFPFINAENEIEYIQGRRLKNNGPKYLNLNGVKPTFYNKSILSEMKKGDRLIICEGITDAMSAIQLKLPCIGILGASGFKSEWLKYFIDYEILALPDNDAGGETFFNDLSNQFKKIGKPIRRITIGKSNDLNDFINDK